MSAAIHTPTPAPNLWHAIGYGEGGADDRFVRSDQEMVDFLWEECGPDDTGDEAKTRAFWAAFVADDDNWRHLDDVKRWWCTVDIGETGHVAFIRVLDAAPPCQSHDALLAACEAQHEAIDRLFAQLIEVTRGKWDGERFMPSKSGQPWEATLLGVAAIRAAKGGV